MGRIAQRWRDISTGFKVAALIIVLAVAAGTKIFYSALRRGQAEGAANTTAVIETAKIDEMEARADATALRDDILRRVRNKR